MASKLTPELIERAKLAKSAEEIFSLAKENGAELSAESAKAYFAQLHKTGELNDDELDSVSGGEKCGTIYNNGRPVVTMSNSCEHWRCENCHIAVLKKTENDYDICVRCGAIHNCRYCEHARYEDALLQCFCEERRYN